MPKDTSTDHIPRLSFENILSFCATLPKHTREMCKINKCVRPRTSHISEQCAEKDSQIDSFVCLCFGAYLLVLRT